MQEERFHHIDRWAAFCKAHPKEAKKAVNEFIDAQIDLANRFYERLKKTPEGRKIFARLMKLRQQREV